jgi:hypothetical protein
VVPQAVDVVAFNPATVRCSFFDRNPHSRMPLVLAPARFNCSLEALKRAGV